MQRCLKQENLDSFSVGKIVCESRVLLLFPQPSNQNVPRLVFLIYFFAETKKKDLVICQNNILASFKYENICWINVYEI